MKKPANSQPQISIREYLRLRDFYQNLPGRITPNGEMVVLFGGEWLSMRELDKVIKLPVMPRFGATMDNPDRTKIWMYE